MFRAFLYLNFIFLSHCLCAQKDKPVRTDTIFYNASGKTITRIKSLTELDSSGSYMLISRNGRLYFGERYWAVSKKLHSKGNFIDKSRTLKTGQWLYYENDTLIYEENYIHGKLDGLKTEYYKSGEVHFLTNYKLGQKNGSLKSFFVSGALKREDIYEKGTFVEGKCFDEQGNQVEYYPLATDADFVGGNEAMIEYLRNKLDFTYDSNYEGGPVRVFVQFKIMADGSITNVRIIKSGSEFFDNAALKVINEMPKWIPGTFDGEAVDQLFNLPMRFK